MLPCCHAAMPPCLALPCLVCCARPENLICEPPLAAGHRLPPPPLFITCSPWLASGLAQLSPKSFASPAPVKRFPPFQRGMNSYCHIPRPNSSSSPTPASSLPVVLCPQSLSPLLLRLVCKTPSPCLHTISPSLNKPVDQSFHSNLLVGDL
ncbi:hypothetical protein N431DRAFT_47915 [Stipitochalara longipes BDJ]|nr:hypothetical protein N431DRAFT_47915 [Stipitochalara longipes BDJ]